MPRLNRHSRELLKDELVDEAIQAKLVAAHEGRRLAKLGWYPNSRGQSHYTLLTPYGTLTVSMYSGPCSWVVKRNSIPLVWQKNPRKKAVLTSLAAAQAAGLIHLRDGFGGSASERTSLRWRLDCPNVAVRSQQVPDDHERAKAPATS
jgi:hypothetical protein